MARSSRTKSSVSIDLFNLPPLPDAKKHSTMISEIPNYFFLPDGKNTQLSKVINTWTFDRLTPNGNEGVGVKLDYLERAYGTRYFVIDTVNGDINAIHDESLELTEFKGRFRPFDLDNLEARICKLSKRAGDEEDAEEQHISPRLCLRDPRTLNMDDYEGMGLDMNKYSPIQPINRESQKLVTPRPTSTPKLDELILNRSDPTDNRGKIKRVNSFEIAQERAASSLKFSKGGPVKGSSTKSLHRPSTSHQAEQRRPQLNCTACRRQDHLRKDCREDVFCDNCRTRSHATEVCRALSQHTTGNILCVYCGSTNHTSSNCRNKPNDNREEPRSTPRDLRQPGPRMDYNRMNHQEQVSHQQTRFDEGLNRRYSPNYINPYQSPLRAFPGQDLSATLIELANIQSRSMEMMAASQRSQQEAFQELARVSKDKSNDSMFTAIKTFDGTNRQHFEDWIDEVNQACRASNRGFRTELFKKSAGAVRQVILSCDNLSDNELVTKLRSCFSHAPTMNEAREELRNMQQMEHESVSVYRYRWGRALYRSSGIRPDEERHPHVIKDFISSLKKNIRNKIANRWVEMRHPPSTVERAFELACNVEKQLQVADSFKLEFPAYNSRDVNEISAEESSGDKQEINEISKKKWVSNSNPHGQRRQNFNNKYSNYRHQQQWPQEGRQHKQWTQKPKDSKITLSQESDHYIPAQLSSEFFRKIDLAMKLKTEELKEQKPKTKQLNKMTEENLMQAFGISEDQLNKATSILERSESTENSEYSSA